MRWRVEWQDLFGGWNSPGGVPGEFRTKRAALDAIEHYKTLGKYWGRCVWRVIR